MRRWKKGVCAATPPRWCNSPTINGPLNTTYSAANTPVRMWHLWMSALPSHLHVKLQIKCILDYKNNGVFIAGCTFAFIYAQNYFNGLSQVMWCNANVPLEDLLRLGDLCIWLASRCITLCIKEAWAFLSPIILWILTQFVCDKMNICICTVCVCTVHTHTVHMS